MSFLASFQKKCTHLGTPPQALSLDAALSFSFYLHTFLLLSSTDSVGKIVLSNEGRRKHNDIYLEKGDLAG